MKTTARSTALLATFATALLIGASAQAQIIGINAASSFASITFDNTLCQDGATLNFGSSYNQSINPWNGLPYGSPFPTDPNTGDNAAGAIDAGNSPTGFSYFINFTGVSLTQPMIPLASTKGPATLTYNFAVEYQLGAFGLPSLPTFFPALLVSGTVQMSSFASVSGSILYDGVVAPATPGSPPTTIDTVNYSYFNGTPGMFTANAVTATPVNGTTPALQPGTTLTLSGSMIFTVDPSELFASSTMVPEPSTALLALLSAPLLLRRRRA